MKKIPSLFQRNYDTDRLCRPELVPGCEWVIEEADQVMPSRMWDGEPCLVRDGQLYRNDGLVGWVLVSVRNSADRWHNMAGRALAAERKVAATKGRHAVVDSTLLPDGTYELVGPRINGNPERLTVHQFVRHGAHPLRGWWSWAKGISATDGAGSLHPQIRHFLRLRPMEGVVFTHTDGRMAKVKARDFGIAWPPEAA